MNAPAYPPDFKQLLEVEQNHAARYVILCEAVRGSGKIPKSLSRFYSTHRYITYLSDAAFSFLYHGLISPLMARLLSAMTRKAQNRILHERVRRNIFDHAFLEILRQPHEEDRADAQDHLPITEWPQKRIRLKEELLCRRFPIDEAASEQEDPAEKIIQYLAIAQRALQAVQAMSPDTAIDAVQNDLNERRIRRMLVGIGDTVFALEEMAKVASEFKINR